MTPAHGSPNQDRSPEASESPPSRPKSASTACPRALQERARSWPEPDRTRLGGPGSAGSPPSRRVRALRARLRIGDGLRERRRVTSLAYGGTARAASIVHRVGFRAATARCRFDPVDFRARVLGSPHSFRDREARPPPRGWRCPDGTEAERELRRGPGGNPRNPEGHADVDRRGWPPATRSASSARRRSPFAALTSREPTLTTGRQHPPPERRSDPGTSDRHRRSGNRSEAVRP